MNQECSSLITASLLVLPLLISNNRSYTTGKQIGGVAFSVVHEGVHKKIGVEMAIKFISRAEFKDGVAQREAVVHREIEVLSFNLF